MTVWRRRRDILGDERVVRGFKKLAVMPRGTILLLQECPWIMWINNRGCFLSTIFSGTLFPRGRGR